MLELSRVGYGFENRAVLSDISFRIEPGDITAIMGPSGCGKTTLLKLAGGALKAQTGRISSTFRQKGYLRQNRSFMPWRTIEENIGLGLELKGPMQTQEQKKVEGLMRELGLEEAAQLYPHQISGGMSRRAALAQILAIEPDFLLLDDAFTGLDFLTHYHVTQTVRRYVRRRNSAALIVTHNFEEALALADRIIVLGGSPAEIINSIDVSEHMSVYELRQAMKESYAAAA